jgi:DNA-binding MarR family transcriptional regulator
VAGNRSRKSGTRRWSAGQEPGFAKTGDPPAGRIRRRAGPLTSLGGLDQMTGYVVRRAQMWMMQDLRRILKDLCITPAQFAVLRVIAANPGLSQVRVAQALGIERARLVQMIDSLEAEGHVTRHRSATDRRSHELRLTAGGTALLEQAQGALEAHERNVAARIGARDKQELLRILAPFVT